VEVSAVMLQPMLPNSFELMVMHEIWWMLGAIVSQDLR
jgi:hypothetical protein